MMIMSLLAFGNSLIAAFIHFFNGGKHFLESGPWPVAAKDGKSQETRFLSNPGTQVFHTVEII